MTKTKIISFFFIFITLSSLSFGSTEQTPRNRNILILFSLVPTTPAYRVILDGIRSQLTSEFGYSCNVQIEYLETDRYPKGNYPKERFDLYNKKYKNIDLDLLICVGIDIVGTIKSYADRYLLDLPTISLDYDFSAYGFSTEISLNNQTAVIPLKVEAEKTINTALEIFPETKSIFIFCGVSNGDRLFHVVSEEAVKKIDSHKKVIFITDTSMMDALGIAHRLPENSIVIASSFTTDSKQVPYSNPESVRLISSAANAPVFSYTDTGFGEGSIGGYMIDFTKVGLLTGEIAVKLLNGVDPNSIKVTEKDYYEYLFDWRELERWHIAGSDLIPEESIILFKDFNPIHQYKWFIIGGLLFLILQTMLILNLIRLNRKQKLLTLQIIESENKYRELVREDRILRIGQLTASLSHELNQPLTAILSTAQAGIRFIDSNKANPELLKELFQHIAEDDKRTASILASIRGMLKVEKRDKEKVILNDLIEEVLAIYKSEAIIRRIRLKAILTADPVCILADRTQIQQVIMNLVLNAFQEMEKIQKKDKTLWITESVEDEHVTVSVKDQGRGIDASIKDTVFKPFVTSKKEGMGIGLALSHSIIHDHQGSIWAENLPQGGAEFSFRLKIIQDEG